MENWISFLQTLSPFNLLPVSVLEDVANIMTVHHYVDESTVYEQDKSEVQSVDIIVEGQYDAYFYDSEGQVCLVEHYNAGSVYGASSVLLNKKKSIRQVIAQKETTAISLDKEEFKSICRSYDDFFHHFTIQFGQKMLNDEYAHFVKRDATREENFMDADNIFTRRISTIDPRRLITLSAEETVQEAADLMYKKTVNCMYIEQDGKLIGSITKDILLKQILAAGRPMDTPVIDVANCSIISIHRDALLFEALLIMFQSKEEFILVVDGEENLGYLSRYRLLTEHAQSPLVFIQSVKLSRSVNELKNKWDRVPELIAKLIGRGVNSEIVNRIVTTISDEILLKVIEIVENEMPPAPAKYAFMVMGSEGRQEQTLVTDQDNAIIYEDKANEQRELVREYFLEFANKVSTQLNDIGFKFCDGGYMAMNPKWTHSLSHWKGEYDEWIKRADPELVIQFSTFFDCRFIYGEEQLFDGLKEYMVQSLDNASSKFYYSLTVNALQYDPPLTSFFKEIKTFSHEEKKVFNIKKAMVPIVDLMRMWALKHRIIETNTGKRMQKLLEGGYIDEKKYKELIQAYYYLMGVRLKHQAWEILDNFSPPTNLVEPKHLTQVERATLKEIFKFIKDLQSGVKMEFQY
ncbi:DUF294 nucleotidyltransferase-like domain-containing protein [Flammeovirgaceae bacterium SG7u.111]|nr:DUF294 nucleotidyltransferase-like domain-containing protein [Flammeovirgaceae bacterium SG7u.132]WPO38013.1 DUF294 nucleotidyltransferase-like domain-containing protein [Flammeovirgaceae bacterium SG7u.111]